VIAEHDISGAVIGVSFDGTGYGTDGNVWGGEFLICEGNAFERVAHLKNTTLVGGDVSMREAWKSAICYAYQYEKKCRSATCWENSSRANPLDGVTEEADGEIAVDISDIIEGSNIRKHESWELVTRAIEQKINVIESSSMGRLFDAVSSLLDICHENSYEGECATLLEDAAAEALKNPGNRKNDLALEFHNRVASIILERCVKIREDKEINKVALSGGVFQNKILMNETLKLLRSENFEVYYNSLVSPNDGGIALGQNYVGMCLLMEQG
jgi:hydrogenase maturation protein HypF